MGAFPEPVSVRVKEVIVTEELIGFVNINWNCVTGPEPGKTVWLPGGVFPWARRITGEVGVEVTVGEGLGVEVWVFTGE
jgi:hypothetical protein